MISYSHEWRTKNGITRVITFKVPELVPGVKENLTVSRPFKCYHFAEKGQKYPVSLTTDEEGIMSTTDEAIFFVYGEFFTIADIPQIDLIHW